MNGTGTASGRLPRGPRWAAIIAVVLCAWYGMTAVQDVVFLRQLSDPEAAARELRVPLPQAYNEFEPVIRRSVRAQLASLAGMRGSRGVLLGALALCCSLGFVAGVRLLRPAGLPREGMRRLLAGACLGAAVLRTLEGAQLSVAMRKATDVMIRELPVPSDIQPEMVETWRSSVASLATGFWVVYAAYALGVAAVFAALAQYFRSDKVKEIVSLADHPVE